MRESMTLIEEANIFKKTNHRNIFADRVHSKNKEDLRTLSFDVYSSRHLFPPIKPTKRQRSDDIYLPVIDKDDSRLRRKTKRPSFRASFYHSNAITSSQIELPVLTTRGARRDALTRLKDTDTVMNLPRHHAPPPSPSDDQIERLLNTLDQTRRSSPASSTYRDGYIPYRLPALHQSAQHRDKDFSFPSKEIKSTLSNYFENYY